MRALAFVALAAVVLAGCSGGKAADHGKEPAAPAGGLPMLRGFVFDDALRPMAGVTVKVLENNASAVTGDQGDYRFAALPTDQFLVIVANKSGFLSSSKQVTLSPQQPVLLNFTLSPVPVAVQSIDKLKQELIVECEVGVVANSQNNTMPCGTGTQGKQAWEIAVGPKLEGAVVEVFWTPTTQAAASGGAKLETLELGQLNLVLGEVVGEGPLRIFVPQTTAERYYVSGGLMRLTVHAAPNAAETEAGVGASAFVNQKMTAYASLFYGQPPDPTYTIAAQA